MESPNIDFTVCDSALDLGVLFSSSLCFSSHINSMSCKARNSWLAIKRCFRTTNADLLYRAYTVYVRPILEYCSSVWSPYRLYDIRKIESVQRSFTKRLSGLEDLSYMHADRLTNLKSDTLELRRLKSDLTMYYFIIHG